MVAFVQVIAAYLLADAIGGLYHLATDLGYNFAFQVRAFHNHHERPWTMQFPFDNLVGAAPLAVAAYFVAPWFLGWLAFFIAISQLPHYYAHHRHKAPRWYYLLERLRLVITSSHHDGHHTATRFDRNFCVFTGHNDWWLNPIARWVVSKHA